MTKRINITDLNKKVEAVRKKANVSYLEAAKAICRGKTVEGAINHLKEYGKYKPVLTEDFKEMLD